MIRRAKRRSVDALAEKAGEGYGDEEPESTAGASGETTRAATTAGWPCWAEGSSRGVSGSTSGSYI